MTCDQPSLLADGVTVWRGRKVSVRERQRNAERAKEWRQKNAARFKKKRDEWMAANAERVRKKKAQHYQLNKEAIALYEKKRYQKNKEHIKALVAVGRLFRKYRLTPDQRAAMEIAQQSRCAICHRHASETSKSQLCVDHDHATGNVRALLCDDCNVGLGRFRDNAQWLRNAAAYLQEHERGIA